MTTLVQSKMRHAPGLLELDGVECAKGGKALRAIDPHTGEFWATLTVRLDVEPPAGCLFVKDWSENEGALATLVDAGLVVDTGERIPTGYCSAAVVKLTPKGLGLWGPS